MATASSSSFSIAVPVFLPCSTMDCSPSTPVIVGAVLGSSFRLFSGGGEQEEEVEEVEEEEAEDIVEPTVDEVVNPVVDAAVVDAAVFGATTTLAVASMVANLKGSLAAAVEVVVVEVGVSEWTTNSTLVVFTGDLMIPEEGAADDRGDA